MKKFITICLFIGLLFSFYPGNAWEVNQKKNRSENLEKRQPNQKKKHKSKKQGKESSTATKSEEKIKKEKEAKDQKKKEIEIKEYSIDKNKKVKRVSTDKNLPETIRNRNIP